MKTKDNDISKQINHLSETDSKWFAIYTKYKCEKYVADLLGKKGIASYVPLIEKTKRYSSGIKRHSVPLINCYVFVEITKEQYVNVLETEYVLGFLKQRKNLISIPEQEIDILRLVVGEIEDIESENLTLQRGDRVEVVSGQLTGIQGELIDKEGSKRFVVALTTVGMQLSMTIDKSKLKLIKREVAVSQN